MSSTYVDGTTPLDAAHMNALQQKVEKGLANGYVGLDASGNVALASAAKVVWAGDTNIYRGSQAAELRTDGYFRSTRTTVGSYLICGGLGSDAALGRWAVQADGKMLWGDGTTAPGLINLYNGVNGLTCDQYVEVKGGLLLTNNGAANYTGIRFGTAFDTNLYRSAVNTLKTDGDLWVQGRLIGPAGGQGAQINMRTGSGLSVEWGSGQLKFYVDNTLVKTL